MQQINVLHYDKTQRAFENKKEMKKKRAARECFLHFSSVPKCLECFITAYALWYKGNEAKENNSRFFCGLYSDNPWVFDQSERARGTIYIINIYILSK